MRALVGLAAGIALAVAALSAPAGRSAVVLPDQGGALREIVVHYSGHDLPDVLPVYAELFAALPPDVRILACVPDEEAFVRFRGAMGRAGVTRVIVPVLVGRAITSWAKDRCMVVVDGDRRILYVPEEPVEGAAGRRNDWLAPFAIAEARPEMFSVASLPLNFDGGDIMVAEDAVFISDYLLAKNDRPTDEVLSILEEAFGRPVILLRDAPDHHIGMYLMPVGGRRIVLADAFDHLRSQLESLGYEVIDIPIVMTADRYVWRSYTNVVVDARRVYLAQYNDEADDARARAVWESLGFQVVPIDCSAIYMHGGSLRCLVNILDRGV